MRLWTSDILNKIAGQWPETLLKILQFCWYFTHILLMKIISWFLSKCSQSWALVPNGLYAGGNNPRMTEFNNFKIKKRIAAFFMFNWCLWLWSWYHGWPRNSKRCIYFASHVLKTCLNICSKNNTTIPKQINIMIRS